MSDRHASSAGAEAGPETAPEPHSSSSTFLRRLQVRNIFSTICDSLLSPILFLFHFLRKILCGGSDSAHHNHVNRIAYSVLHRATSSFSDQTLIGRGGFGSVYRGFHPSLKQIAVKVMDSGSLQGEREFQNELFFAQKINQFEGIVTPIGYSYNRRRRRVLLVYNLMENGNLQDALLRRKCAELMEWERRYSVALDIGKGIEFLHSFDPPIIHGDIKPSNILLDQNFKAKIGDFGLARMKTDVVVEVNLESDDPEEGKKNDPQFSVEGSVDEFSVKVNQYPECVVAIDPNCLSSDAMEAGGSEIEGVVGPVASPSTVCSEGNADKESLDGKREASGMRRSQNRKTSLSRMDWWWRQDSGSIENGTVKDYVMDWLGGEIKKENTKRSWVEASPESPKKRGINWCRKKIQKKIEWWRAMEKNKSAKKKKVRRRPKREWWKEEFCEELTRKKKKKKKRKKKWKSNELNWWERDEEVPSTRKKRSGGSIGSMDWWWEGFSGELWRARRHSFDSVSGDIPKSGGVSSTPSMRGTVCYIAPEYGVGGDVSEKCDVYSYGVLLLVLVAGRRPLEVTGSPLSEFQRANLMSWARRLARSGKLLDLLDQSMESLDQDQAILCITVALMCLQRSPSSRPSMKQVYGMLSGELPRPQLPVEFSPSPPSRFPFKYQRRVKTTFGTE